MLERFYQIDEAAGVAIHIQKDSRLVIGCCQVKILKEELSFGKKVTGLSGIPQIADHIKPQIPLALNLSGKGIIYKQVDSKTLIDAKNFASILPNADVKDFYIQQFSSGKKNFVALIRKETADTYLEALQGMGFKVLMLSLGPFPVHFIWQQLNVYDQELLFSGVRITIDNDGDWLALDFDPQFRANYQLKIDLETVEEGLIMPYAAVFQMLLSAKLDAVEVPVPGLSEMYRKTISQKKLKVQATLVLVACFVLLFVNFILFSSLFGQNQQLSAALNNSVQNVADLKKLDDQTKEKEGLLLAIGWEGTIDNSRLIDQLATLLPAGVTWKQVAVNPYDDSAIPGRRLPAFTDHLIRISGIADRIIPVNEWIARIKSKKWVKDVVLENYTFDHELNSGRFIVAVTY